jgi:hypothetical protein
MFKASQNCRSPHVNIDVTRDALFQSEFLSNRSLTTKETLVDAIELANVGLGKELTEHLKKAAAGKKKKKSSSTKDKALEKAIEYKFFLGLDSAWMHRDFD